MKDNADKPRVVRVLGLGLDNDDGHIRITNGKNFNILLGSEQSHERMQETCIKMNEKLEASGRQLEDLSPDEFVDLISDIK